MYVAGFAGFLFLLLILLLASIIFYIAYRRWKDKQITYIQQEVRCLYRFVHCRFWSSELADTFDPTPTQHGQRNNLNTKYREIDWDELDLLELLGAGGTVH